MYYPTPYYVIIITKSLIVILVRLMNLEFNESCYVPYSGPAWMFLTVWGIFLDYFSKKNKTKVEKSYTLQHMQKNKTFYTTTDGG